MGHSPPYCPRYQAPRLTLALVVWTFISVGFATEPTARPAVARAASAQELRTHDRAFALLIETYREFRSCQIENGYEARLNGIAAMSTNDHGYVIAVDSEVFRKLRALMLALAGKERELEHAKVQTQVENWLTAYHCARRQDEQATGQRVPSQVDLREAAGRLDEFVAIRPGLTPADDHPPAQPARQFLQDTPPVKLPPGHIVPPCTPQDAVIEFAAPPATSDDHRL